MATSQAPSGSFTKITMAVTMAVVTAPSPLMARAMGRLRLVPALPASAST
jgi:hypothetical protein